MSDEGGYTSVAVAVSLLVCFVLVFACAAGTWTRGRSADVQPVADAAALAGSNVVGSYATVATLLDACVLSMGIAGMVTMGVGLVASAVPGLSGAGAATTKAASGVLDARQRFATTAARGLRAIEGTLPLAIVARSAAVVDANDEGGLDYTGCAVPFPQVSETDFSALDKEVDGGEMEGHAEDLREASDRAKAAQDAADAAEYEGWLADCGNEPRNMQERAGRLAGLGGGANPDYPSPEGWDFGVALSRARSYYAQRLRIEGPEGGGIEALTDSAVRSAFFEFALGEVSRATFVEHGDKSVDADLPELPRNTGQMRQTSLYTDARWPCTAEEAGRTLHSVASCPGAQGASSGSASLAQLEAGAVAVCDVCDMEASDMGKVAAASTSIDNGFEHYWQRVVEASRDFERARDELAQAERDMREASERSSSAFEQALSQLAAPRPRLRPAGAWGCVSVVARGAGTSVPTELTRAFLSGSELPAAAAVSASTLAPDESTRDGDVLTGFFAAVVEGAPDGVAGLVASFAGLWSSVLEGYAQAYDGVGSVVADALDVVEGVGAGSIASWLKGRLSDLVAAAGLEPVDLRQRKPVLVNSQSVLDQAGVGGVGTVRSLVGSVPEGAGPAELARALGQRVANELGRGQYTVAEIPIPGTEVTIPLTLDVGELLGAGTA